MHAGFEGYMEYHLRALWGLGQKKETVKQIAEREADEQFSQVDTEEAGTDLESLDIEMSEASEENSSIDLIDSDEEMEESLDGEREEEADEEESDGSATPPTNPGSSTFFNSEMASWDLELSDDEGGHDDPNFIGVDPGAFQFTSEQVKAIHQCITDVMLPSWVERPPVSFSLSSSQSSGSMGMRLKASGWKIFVTLLPP
ncbi:hypothetical protein GYMLUDRAFT_62301 [Collybiopsis luxurians FD-317 M1]|uniref:Uncharacterized protein n=1 Tax=Collybiopsis luxurians FD-317 M1 TaxID=944289 RepID=A0A0D0CDC9_9AGAR|nr:hypothetical protein GYMLUDRAFT_62301 [Collybiopsis luxurians FD-317 M1]